jgi:hypothetical protein
MTPCLYLTLALAAIVAAVSIATVPFAVSQQVLAGGRYNHDNSGISKVSQAVIN